MNDGCASVEDMILAAYPNASDPKATNATTALTPKYQQFSMSDWERWTSHVVRIPLSLDHSVLAL